jgi:hypothetical protein
VSSIPYRIGLLPGSRMYQHAPDRDRAAAAHVLVEAETLTLFGPVDAVPAAAKLNAGSTAAIPVASAPTTASWFG